MTHHRKTPSHSQLFAAYKAGVDLNRYVSLKQVFKSHDATMAIVTSKIEHVREIEMLLSSGTTIDQIGEVFLKGLDLKEYIQNKSTVHLGIEPSHDEAIEATRLGITQSYRLLRHYGLEHFQIVLLAKELTTNERRDCCTYILCRSRGVSIEDTNALLVNRFQPSDMIHEMLDEGVMPAEIIEASLLDGDDTLIINKRGAYAYLRTNAHADGFDLTHLQAMEVARSNNASGPYITARKNGLSHKESLSAS